ncbi:hypothetical protein [Mesorhizobium caraganae]|uniref:hypothetical protein n=1 Tax=Mesorhizobium caraganae TaxID=483206 RepID=UPI00177A9372|nr:hypothetical protein [Mesorhizobium caraganae]
MDISSASLTALLREAMILAAVPSAKADPGKAALIKALAQPPAPSGAPLQPAAVPALQAQLSATPAKAQQTGSAEILQAYLAIAEPGAGAPDGAPTRAAAAAPANDDAQHGLPVLPPRTDDGAAAKPAGLPWLAFLVPEVSPHSRASATNAAAKRGQATPRSNGAVQPERQQEMRIGLMAVGTGFLAVATIGFVLLVLS